MIEVVALVVAGVGLGWLARGATAEADANAAFHRGVMTGRRERTGFRSIEDIAIEQLIRETSI